MSEPAPSTGGAAPKAAASGQGAPPSPPAQITIEDFAKIALRVGVIRDAKEHPNADRLLILTVDVGEAAPRQIVAGIRGSYQAADLVGKHVAVVANLKPAALRGVESQGMVLAASDSGGIIVLTLDRPAAPGSIIK